MRGPSPPAPPRRRRPDGRRQAARRMLDLEAVRPQDLGDPARGLDLLEGRFRVGMDPVRQPDDLVAGRLDGRGRRAPSASACGSAGRDRQQARIVRSGTAAGADGSGTGSSGRDGWERSSVARAPATASAFRRQGRLGDDGEGDDEQGDGQLQGVLQPQDDEHALMPPTHAPRRIAVVQSPA